MIADLLAILILMLLLYKPVLWVARKLVKREEEMVADIKRGLEGNENEKK